MLPPISWIRLDPQNGQGNAVSDGGFRFTARSIINTAASAGNADLPEKPWTGQSLGRWSGPHRCRVGQKSVQPGFINPMSGPFLVSRGIVLSKPHFLQPLLKAGPAAFLRNTRTGRPVATVVEAALDSASRKRGLLGRDSLPSWPRARDRPH